MISFEDLLSVMPGDPVITVETKYSSLPVSYTEHLSYWIGADYKEIRKMTVTSILAEHTATVKIRLEAEKNGAETEAESGVR